MVKETRIVNSDARDNILDKRILNELLETLSAEGFANRVSMFKLELELLGPILKGLQDESDWDRVAKIAHKNAGGAALFGATRLSHVLCQIEAAARTAQVERLNDLIVEATSLAEVTINALSAFGGFTSFSGDPKSPGDGPRR